MIRNEVVTVFFNTTQVYPTDVKITLGIGKGYNTCSLSGVSIGGSVGDTITITVNADTYVFMATERSYAEKGSVSITGKGIPFVLENQSKSDEILEYTCSDDLINGESGVVVVNNMLPNIEFGTQSYSKVNTPMGRILDMATVVGGETYEVNSVLCLAEIASIPSSPTIAHEFGEEEVFSYAYSENIEHSVLLSQVLINPITDDIYAEASITVEYDDDTQLANVYFCPSLSTGNEYSFLGMSPRPATLGSKTEQILVSEETTITTVGGIDSINYLTVDGETFDNYVVYSPYNIVRFLEVVTGEVEISYVTKKILSSVNSTTNFIITYLCAKAEGTIEVDESDSVSSQNCKVEISSPLTYEDGGTVECYKNNDITLIFIDKKGATDVSTVSTGYHAGGGSLTVKSAGSWSGTAFMSNITSTVTQAIETDSGTVEYNEDLDEYVVYLQIQPESIISVLEGSIGLTGYTYVDSDTLPYISFQSSDEGRSVDISMYVDVVVITIPPPTATSGVGLLDAVGCSGVATSEFTNSDDALCSIPSTFKINVAEMFDVSLITAYGKTVVGDNGIGTKTIDEFGKITVTITQSILYTINCSSVRANAKITVDATGVS